MYIFLYDIRVQPCLQYPCDHCRKMGDFAAACRDEEVVAKKYFSEYHRKIQEKVSKKYKILYNMIQESAGWNIRPAKERRENGKIQLKK